MFIRSAPSHEPAKHGYNQFSPISNRCVNSLTAIPCRHSMACLLIGKITFHPYISPRWSFCNILPVINAMLANMRAHVQKPETTLGTFIILEKEWGMASTADWWKSTPHETHCSKGNTSSDTKQRVKESVCRWFQFWLCVMCAVWRAVFHGVQEVGSWYHTLCVVFAQYENMVVWYIHSELAFSFKLHDSQLDLHHMTINHQRCQR